MIKSINYSVKDENDAWEIYKKELEEMKEKMLSSDKIDKKSINFNEDNKKGEMRNRC